MQFAISIPQFVADGAFDPAGLRAYLTRAEELGFDSAWTMEQVLGTMPTLGPMETMTYAAACTERIRLGCVVFVTPLHSPVHLAKSLSTLDQLSRGRIEVGVGTGGRGRMFSAFEVDPASLVTRFTEEGAAMEPKPFQKPNPPIWFGANHPAALRRAVRYGDGFFGAGSTTTAQFAEQVQIVRGALAEAGRDTASFRIAKRIYIAVDDDAERARRHVAASLVRLYGDFGRSLEPAAVSGPPDACVEGVRDVAEAGAELILFTPFFNEAEQMERLAAEVAPKLL